MIMVMTQHVLPRKDDPPKSVSPDAHPHDEGCMFYGLLENAMLKNTERRIQNKPVQAPQMMIMITPPVVW